jgi:hypothetical protein
VAIKASKGIVRFEAFELDLRAGELRKDGRNPFVSPSNRFAFSLYCSSMPGEVVNREEIRKKPWPNDTIRPEPLGQS